ncbi:MAG TPA: hypothetical protein VGJ88_02555 [Thermoanaerobaculia bacterium]|jgi:hypothetical protein
MVLDEWAALPDAIECSLREGVTRRETVHHLLEASLVASNMIVAALGTDEYEFDWAWLVPDEKWRARLGYDQIDEQPALELFRALTKYISALLTRDPALIQRRIRLRDSTSTEPYAISIEDILSRELDHAREHLALAP